MESIVHFLEQSCRTLGAVDYAMAPYAQAVQLGKNRHDNRSSFIALAPTIICLFFHDGHAIYY